MNAQIAGICERDMDLLLLEEFQACEAFQAWFVQAAFGGGVDLGRCTEARRSYADSTGESDLEVFLAGPEGGTTVLLIENKVNAGLQPQQAERYRERGLGHVLAGLCQAFRTIIVAPARYFGTASSSSKGFDGRVTYEEILGWFEGTEQLGARRLYKMALLRSAIEKGVLGYQPEEDKPNTLFWRAYWQLALVRAPQLEMLEPGPRPSRSSFVYFRPPDLPPSVKIIHKFAYGHVDLQLKGMGRRLNEVRKAAERHLADDMRVVEAGCSAAIRVRVPRLTSTQPFENQKPEAERALDTASRLHAWLLDCQEFREWLRSTQAST